MRDKVSVRISNSADNLLEKEAGILLGDVVILYVVVEFSTLGKFHDNKDVVGGIQ